MAADKTGQPAPQAQMTETEFIAWMERVGFRLTPRRHVRCLLYTSLLRA